MTAVCVIAKTEKVLMSTEAYLQLAKTAALAVPDLLWTCMHDIYDMLIITTLKLKALGCEHLYTGASLCFQLNNGHLFVADEACCNWSTTYKSSCTAARVIMYL